MGLFDIFKRTVKITEANIYDLLEKAEDPVKMLDQYMRDVESQFSKLTISVADAITEKNKVERTFKSMKKEVEDIESSARRAALANDDGTARTLILQLKKKKEAVLILEEQFNSVSKSVDILKEKYSKMKDHIKDLAQRKDILVLKAKTAQSMVTVNKIVNSFDTNCDAEENMNRVEKKISEIECRADAIDEVSDLKNKDELKESLYKFKKEDDDDFVQKELQRLKSGQ